MSDAADKLARTRLAIIEHVHRKEARRDKQGFFSQQRQDREERQDDGTADGRTAGGAGTGGRRFRRARRAARSYWRHHPARLGLQMATPLLSQYARRKPLAYLGIAAAAGALLMVARPWRLISVTGVLMALVKSPQLAGLVMSFMSGQDGDEDDEA